MTLDKDGIVYDKVISDSCDRVSELMYNNRPITIYRWYFKEDDNYAFCTVVYNSTEWSNYHDLVRHFGQPSHYGMSEELRLRELSKQDIYSTLLILENEL